MIRILVEDEPTKRTMSLHVKDNAIIRIQSVMPTIRIQSVTPTMWITDRPKILAVSHVCGKCRAHVPIDARFCTECGQRLTGRTVRA